MPRWRICSTAARELGLKQVGLYGIYQLGLRSGYYLWRTNPRKAARAAGGINPDTVRPLWDLPSTGAAAWLYWGSGPSTNPGRSG